MRSITSRSKTEKGLAELHQEGESGTLLKSIKWGIKGTFVKAKEQMKIGTVV